MAKTSVSVKCKLYNLGLSLKDTAHLQNQVVSSVSSSSKAPIDDPALPIDSVRVNGVALELKADGPTSIGGFLLVNRG